MFEDQSKRFKDQFTPLDAINVDEYKKYVGDEAIEELKTLAAPLKGKVWSNVNSTFDGGGVAEMLRSVIPFAKGLGINCRWYCIEGTDDFFSITKKFHNMMQGVKDDITMEEVLHSYLDTVNDNFIDDKIAADMVIVHDPQPAAAIMSGKIFGQIVWRCHIDTSAASRRIWRFLLPYINHADGAIFTLPEFAQKGLNVPVYEISPSIDPIQPKNKEYTTEEANEILEPLFAKYNIDKTRPYILAVSRYDIHKNQKTIVQAFKQLKAKLTETDPAPILIIVGNAASDDPEGEVMYKMITDEIDGDKDIYPLLNIEDNDRAIGALMKQAECFVHVSTKEGFGLVVTEAMWQGTPVIGSTAGGIKKQVIDEETGFIVEPKAVDEIVKNMEVFLKNKKERDSLGKKAKEHVRKNFLLPSLVKKYLYLMRYYLEVDTKAPAFRCNGMSYSEIKKAAYGRKTWSFTHDELNQTIKDAWKE